MDRLKTLADSIQENIRSSIIKRNWAIVWEWRCAARELG